MLCAINGKCRMDSVACVSRIVDMAAGLATYKIFKQATNNHDYHLSFEEFAAWYTNGGHQLLPWLELLDLRKWDNAVGAGSGAHAQPSGS